MSNETEGVFTFTWNVDTVRQYILTGKNKKFLSPPFAAKTLRDTIWSLELNRCEILHPPYWRFILYRQNDGKSENVAVKCRLELIDAHGIILKSIVRENCYFLNNSGYEIAIDSDHFGDIAEYLIIKKVVTVRCHIMDESYNIQAMTREISTVIRTQWIIKTPSPKQWTKKIKVPFYECSHMDIIISASDERINIKIKEVDLLKFYKLKITVLNDENRKIVCNGTNNFIGSTADNKSLETWIEKSQLVDESRDHLPYSFTLVCSISTSNENSVSDSESNTLDYYFPSSTDPCLPLQEDLKKMLLDEKHTDVKLQSHDKIIPVHKCLLSARSPVFSTMFDQDMLETHTGVVDIPDIEGETLQSFLEFLYTDTITNTDYEKVLKMMVVADKYQVDVLKERCSQILIAKLSVENICQVVSVAEMVNHSELKLAAINFIKENKKEIISSTIWSEWMKKNMELANEVLMKLIVD